MFLFGAISPRRGGGGAPQVDGASLVDTATLEVATTLEGEFEQIQISAQENSSCLAH